MSNFEMSQLTQRFLDRTGARAVSRLEGSLNDINFKYTSASASNQTLLSFPQEAMKDTPVAYYRVNETVGTSAADLSGNVLTGTYSNVTLNESALLTYPSGANVSSGPSVKFVAASNSKVTLPTSGLLNITSDITLELWLKTTTTSFGVMIGGYSGTGGYGLAMNPSTAAGKFGYFVGGSWYESTTAVHSGSPVHVVMTGSNTQIKLYINGGLDRTIASSGRPSTYAGTRLLGVDVGLAQYYDGWLDEIAVYGSALSAARILAHYNAGTATPVVL